jgi:Short C-terminal domain
LKGEKEILLEHITSIQFKDAGSFVNGYIQFSITGGQEDRGGIFDAVYDENTVLFNEEQEASFRALRRRLEQRRIEVRAPREAPAPTRSRLDDIERLVSLRDRGILTEDEFQREKRKLLGG